MNKILVVGGAKPGIGQATTEMLTSRGFSVVATVDESDKNDASEFIAQQPNTTFVYVNITKSNEMLELLSELAKDFVGAVVADFYFYMEARDAFDLEKWNASLFANLTLPKFIGHLALNNWNQCKSVVFVTSSESNTGSFGAHAYAASKAATHNLCRSLSNVAAGKCRFNCVAAGWIGGVMDTDEVFNRSRSVTPVGRLGDAKEIAEVAWWLLSSQSSFVNGATIFADGGYTGVDVISKFEFESEFGPVSD